MQQSPFDFVVSLVTSLVPFPKLPLAARAVFPLLTELLTSGAVLTDDTRARYQTQVLRLLRQAGLEGVDIE